MANTIEGQTELLQDLAQDALSTARETASRIGGFIVNGANKADFNFNYSDPNLQEPPKFSDLFPGSDSSGEQIQFLNGEVEKWIDKYFPEINGCLRTAPEEWICNILTGTNEYGLNPAVFDIVWQRARDRAYRTSATEQKTLDALFSGRGFTLPPGVMLQAQSESEQRASAAIAEVNRAQMERDAEIKLDLMKFAEEQAVRLKLGIMDSLRGFYTAWMQVPDKDIERAKIRAQAQSSLYSALSSYYNVELGFENLRLRAEQVRTGVQIDNNKLALNGMDAGRNSALASAASGFAQVAAAAGNAGGALFADITTGA